jgi:ABC-2 type transport system ATP-binding protein
VADRPTGTLSKGYRQRVGLAQALLGDPEVLVLDEPTVGLDPVQTLEMRGLVRGLAGRTVLFSTHVLSEASAVCSRVIILARGHLLAEDTAAGLGRRLTGTGRIMVRVDGPAEAVGAALGELPGVARLERPVPDGQPGVAWDLIAVDTEVVRRAIAGAVVARGWTLLELHVAVPTLEDVFVRVLDAAQGAGS